MAGHNSRDTASIKVQSKSGTLRPDSHQSTGSDENSKKKPGEVVTR